MSKKALAKIDRNDLLRKPPSEDGQLDFFAPPILDLDLKDQREVMERPFLSLSSTRPQKTPIEYTSPDGSVWVKVDPHPRYGMATIHDWDIVIWAASHIWERINGGEQPYRTIRFFPYSLLKAVRRHAGGSTDYKKLEAALNRLRSTYIRTSIKRDGAERRWRFRMAGRLEDRSRRSQRPVALLGNNPESLAL